MYMMFLHGRQEYYPCSRVLTGCRYPGEGVSRGLARGLLVFSDDENITGEGMGIGAPAVKSQGCFCFARSCPWK